MLAVKASISCHRRLHHQLAREPRPSGRSCGETRERPRRDGSTDAVTSWTLR